MFQNLAKFLAWKYSTAIILTVLFLVGLSLRTYLINQNLFFGPEQGRDMLVIRDMVLNHKLVLIGPTTAIQGVFHGPLYYYLATIPFFISKGNPLFISYFFIAFNTLAVFLIYLLGKELFSKTVGIFASIIFTFSFGAIVMARWLSHPPLIIPFACLFFLFLTKFVKGKNLYLLPIAVAYGLVAQTEFSNFIIFAFIIFFSVVVFWKRFMQQNQLLLIIAGLLVVLLPTFNFILFDLRHNFLITHSILKSQAHRPDFLGYILHTLTGSFAQFFVVFSDTTFTQNLVLGVLIFVLGLYCLKTLWAKHKQEVNIMWIWIFSPFVAFILLRYNPLYHYFTASMVAIIILAAVLGEFILKHRRTLFYLVAVLFVIANLYAVFNFLPNNDNVFFQSTQPLLKYSDEVAVIKQVYQEAGGKPFFYQAYTIPYWMQDGWQYLFWYYGRQYGYLPKQTNKGILFVIIQEDPSTALYQTNWLKDTVSNWGVEEDHFQYGILSVQKREVE